MMMPSTNVYGPSYRSVHKDQSKGRIDHHGATSRIRILLLLLVWNDMTARSTTAAGVMAFSSVIRSVRPQRTSQAKPNYDCKHYIFGPGTSEHGYRMTTIAVSSTSSETSTTEFTSSHLDDLEQSVTNVLNDYALRAKDSSDGVLQLEPSHREAIGVAKHLRSRIDFLARTDSCRRCWLHRATHCVCQQCPPFEGDERIETNIDENNKISLIDAATNRSPLGKVRRLFLLQHHKEIGMVVDTAKFIAAAFPESCQLVVNGIGPEYQKSMRDMMDSIHSTGGKTKCLVLFPADGAQTFDEYELQQDSGRATTKSDGQNEHFSGDTIDMTSTSNDGESKDEVLYDLIVIDGTWSQARKMHSRYMPPMEEGGPQRVCLSKEALEILGGIKASDGNGQQEISGHQLRRHSIEWKKVSTFEAARLFLRDMDSDEQHVRQWELLAQYQKIGDNAAMRQLGPPRYPRYEL